MKTSPELTNTDTPKTLDCADIPQAKGVQAELKEDYGPGTILNGKYQLLERVGDGTMGKVFKAEHLTIHKTVAVKILHENMTKNPEVIERFKREAQAAAAIEDSHVCAVTDFDVTEAGDFYLVMEYLEGETLHKRLRRHGKLPPSMAVGIMLQLLSVLQCAHEHSIVHRDVKPENIILISRDNIPDFVKLLDFGIAHQDSSLCVQSEGSNLKTQLGYLYGTPQYLSPEQATGSEIDFRADLYSCGIMLFEMLTGNVPFYDPSTLKVLHMQAFETPPHLPVEAIECGQQFDEIIQRLLQKDPNDRYPSANALKEALMQLPLSNEGNTWGSFSISMKNLAALADTTTSLSGAHHQQLQTYVCEKGVRCWLFGLTRQKFVLLVALFFFVILMLGVVLTLYFLNTADEPEIAFIPSVGTVSNKPPVIAPPRSFEFSNADFAFSYDPALLAESTMTKALEEFNADRFADCLETLNTVYPRYKTHPNYLRLRLLVLDKLKDREEAAKTFIALCTLEPHAPLNASVRTALYNLVEDKATYKTSIEMFKAAAVPELAMAFSESILHTPYDRHDIRRSRLATIYEAMPVDTLPQWRQLAVRAWTTLDKDKCEKRQEMLQHAYQALGPEEQGIEEFYISLIVPLHDNTSKNCKKRNKSFDCNACMRDWIDDHFETLTNRLAGFPHPLLENLEPLPPPPTDTNEGTQPLNEAEPSHTPPDKAKDTEKKASSPASASTKSSKKKSKSDFKNILESAFSG